MGTISAVRLININYNNNSIRINDETMHFNGESTLVSLQNGGGKSVLVQMLMAPFVHKRYRDAKDRPFEGYFNSVKPSFILVEWKLDGGAGRLMNGLMIRKSQEEESMEPLEMTGIICEYQEPCLYDIHHLPVVERTKKEMNLKGFAACRQLFERFKKDYSSKFCYYDMSNSSQQKQYFDRLREYKIDYKEWENVIKKVNLKEGGLADLFADCKDERGLMEKWFLDTIEAKLDKEGSRMKEFGQLVEMHVKQNYENDDKIQRRETIQKFKQHVLEDVNEEPGIKTLAEGFLATEQKKEMQENKIANFRNVVSDLVDGALSKCHTQEEAIEEKKAQLSKTEYEMFSFGIYNLEEEKKRLEMDQQILFMELDDIAGKQAVTDKYLHQLECAKADEERKLEKQEYDELNERLKVERKKDDELRPRREELGRILYACYDGKKREQETTLEELGTQIAQENERIAEKRAIEEQSRCEILERREQIGALNAYLEEYGNKESDYNRIFGTVFSRNILGRYEEGLFEITLEQIRTQLQKKIRQLRADKKELEQRKHHSNKLSSDLTNKRVEKNNLWHELEQEKQHLALLDIEKEERRKILTYLKLEELHLFDTEGIVRVAEHKIEEIDALLRTMQEKELALKKEYRALAEGTIYELPDNLMEGFNQLGIRITYGMEWLRRNGRSEDDNLTLVRKNPFLPYCLILTEHDLDVLKKKGETLYSSMPVPIIVRSQLEKGTICMQDQIVDFDAVKFYVQFNENLLNEKQLQSLLLAKEKELSKVTDNMQRRKTERDEYYRKRETIRHQELSQEVYERVTKSIQTLNDKLKIAEDKLSELSAEKETNRLEIERLEKVVQSAKEDIEHDKIREERTIALSEEYKKYVSYIKDRECIEKEVENLENRVQFAKQDIEECHGRIYSLDNQKKTVERQLDKVTEKMKPLILYKEQSEMDKTVCVSESFEVLEAEYKAITEKMSGIVKQLEEHFNTAAARLKRAQDKLSKLMKKYNITQEEWEGVFYDEAEEERFLQNEKELAGQYERKREQLTNSRIQISALTQKIEDKRQEMKKVTGQEEPISVLVLTQRNFEAEMKHLQYELREMEKQKKQMGDRLNGYQALQSGLSEYEQLPVVQEVEWDEAFSAMSEKELSDFKGILVRDYRNEQNAVQRCRNQLADQLDEVLRIVEFQDDYYRKPLEAMKRLIDRPADVLRQIDTTVRTYDDLMKKIEVDLSIIEKERSSIMGELLQYIHDVHTNLGKLDSNSTISVRNRSIKMLTISIPDWDEHEEVYRLRLRDFINQVTKKGVELYKNNENAMEYFGTQINTKMLYDTVVGTSNVQIKLYKIEKQKEYPITWAEVAKNSGGEGFLSTFVILSSLLYYIRRDESDIFAEKNEGKVLVMDNPFGLTYSEHLLKPLMEMAKKNNTQLICFSGLGGDSIYGRFDNIYILNLVMASLKNGLQYLRTDHLRGTEPETMVLSQFEVYDQLSLSGWSPISN